VAYLETALYCDSVAYGLVAQWAATHAYTVGQIVRQLAAPSAGSERCFMCIVAGTSLSSEPAWTLTRGAKTAEAAGPTWMECTAWPALCADNTNTNAWHATAGAIALGQIIKNVANDHYFICTTAGTGGTGSEPSWSTTTGATTADASVTWTCIGATSSFTTKWAAAAARLSLFNAVGGWLLNAGMIIFVGDDHAETGASSTTINPSLACSIICIDHTVSLPAGSGNLKTTASVTNSSGQLSVMSTSGGAGGVNFYVYGVGFIQSAAGQLNVANASGAVRGRFEQCLFSFTVTNSLNMALGFQTSGGMALEFVSCVFNFGNTNQGFVSEGSGLYFKGCSFTGSVPGAFYQGGTGAPGPTVCFEGCDLGNLSTTLFSGTNNMGNIVLKDCKLNAAATVFTGSAVLTVDLNRCDSGSAAYRNERYTAWGTETTSITVVRTGGAADGAIPVSRKIVTNSGAGLAPPTAVHSAIPLAIWNTVTGTNRNVTVYGIANDSRVPNNDEVWFDAEYLGSASSPLGSFSSGFKTNILAAASALTANTSAWDSAATARANSHAYNVGDVIKTASNAGRIFFCTTAGTSASSEPAGISTTYTTWSPTDNQNVTISGGNLVMTSASTANCVGRSIVGQTTGKFYFEVAWSGTASPYAVCGVADPSVALGTLYSSYTGSVCYQASTGNIYVNGTFLGALMPAFSMGQTVCMAVDLTNQRAWFRINGGNWNNNATYNPATNTGGYDISAMSGVEKRVFAIPSATASGTVATLNAGASAFAYTVPSGFVGGPATVTSFNYSTAVDGTSGNDGTAIFRAGCRFSQTLTLQGQAIVTWNPSDKSANMVLSNGNLSATSAIANYVGARGTNGLTSGKAYFETTWTGSGFTGFSGIGLATAAAAVGGGVSAGGVVAADITGNIWTNGASGVGPIAGLASGDRICVAVDFGNHNIWFRTNGGNWNGSGTANPSTNTGGLSISGQIGGAAAFPYIASGNTVTTGTANFGATAFAQAVPSGFSSWNSLSQPIGEPQQPGYLYAYPRIGRPSTTYYLDPLLVLS
jgi:hypothetical protein